MAHVEFFRPKVRDDVPEHAWLDGARVNVLLHDCKHGWSQDLITCLADAWQEDGVLDCLAFRMDDDARDAQEKKLRALEKLAVKVEKARQTPAELDCDHVVAARYADARWKGKLAGVERDRRVQLIEASRTLMRSACIDYEWSEATRACVIVTGELVPCFDDDYATRWGYPAAPAK